MNIRPVRDSDCVMLYRWRRTLVWPAGNPPDNWGQHLNWFCDRADRDWPWFILTEGNLWHTPMGLVRFDPDKAGEEDGPWFVSILIAPRYRSRGVGAAALRQLDGVLPGKEVLARIHCDNLASIKAFERAGYTLDGTNDGIWLFYKRP